MKEEPFYKQLIRCDTPDDVFAYLIDNLKETITGWDYYINWNKVKQNIGKVEIHLNILNSLIGKKNIKQEARKLLKKYPEIISALPVLIAWREKDIHILDNYNGNQFSYSHYSFDEATDLDGMIYFMEKSGIFSLISDRKIKSLVDYVWGVEVGLDSNGRKNRGGTAMEEKVELFIKNICKNGDKISYISQTTQKKLEETWGDMSIDIDKRIDFVIKKNEKLFLIETNFYRKGGSKLEATAEKYQMFAKQWKRKGRQFIWITDGQGWATAKKDLRKAFDEMDYVLNLKMLEKGILERIIKQ